jgi:hypothetical protein
MKFNLSEKEEKYFFTAILIVGISIIFASGMFFNELLRDEPEIIYERPVSSDIPTVIINADYIYSKQTKPIFETTGGVIIKFSPNVVCVKDTTGYILKYD